MPDIDFNDLRQLKAFLETIRTQATSTHKESLAGMGMLAPICTALIVLTEKFQAIETKVKSLEDQKHMNTPGHL